MATKKHTQIETVGWKFWLVAFVVLIVPGYLALLPITRESTPWYALAAGGVVFAAIGAGVVSWAVNSLLQYRVRKRRHAERKSKKR